MQNVTFGEIIKSTRIKKKLKQYELAELVGISRSYLSDIENNRYIPSGKTLLKIDKEIGLFYLSENDGNTIQKERD